MAKWRGHDEVSLGMILGSNIFNGLLIVGVVAMISPFTLAAPREVFATLGFGIAAVVLLHPPKNGFIPRLRGAWLLLYLVYSILLLLGTR